MTSTHRLTHRVGDGAGLRLELRDKVPLYSPTFRELVFSETRLPVWLVFSETRLTLRAKVVRHLPKPAESRDALPKL